MACYRRYKPYGEAIQYRLSLTALIAGGRDDASVSIVALRRLRVLCLGVFPSVIFAKKVRVDRWSDNMLNSDDLRHTKLALNNGYGSMPALGFGTLIPDPVATHNATKLALETGFRLLDTAERYRTEREVGDAMREVFQAGKIKREDVFVITKLWNTNHRPERVRPAFEASRAKLQLDYVDLYLIHTPFAFRPGDEQDPRDANGKVIYDPGVTLLDTWRAMESLVDEGKCRAIGLSDVGLGQTQAIVEAARIKPAVVHVESHPYLPEWDLLNYCKNNGIVLQAFASLGHSSEPKLLEDPVITAIARRLNKTPAQVLLAWAIQRGTAPLTTSKTPSRIRENFDVSPLPDDAMHEISGIQTRVRLNAVVETGVPGFIPRRT
jgi:diketogulonate reductase-like aldo/keto reductase